MKQVSCSCGANRIAVPCGMEKITKVPKCRRRCDKPNDCHHSKIQDHYCHFGQCPPCNLPCGRQMSCGHDCIAACHDKVKVKVTNQNAAGPWEQAQTIETRTLDCPDCPQVVPVQCLGQHDTSNLPCHAAKVTSCGRPCGRPLPCGNHVCQRKCHKVKHAKDSVSAGSNCVKCELQWREAKDFVSAQMPRFRVTPEIARIVKR